MMSCVSSFSSTAKDDFLSTINREILVCKSESKNLMIIFCVLLLLLAVLSLISQDLISSSIFASYGTRILTFLLLSFAALFSKAIPPTRSYLKNALDVENIVNISSLLDFTRIKSNILYSSWISNGFDKAWFYSFFYFPNSIRSFNSVIPQFFKNRTKMSYIGRFITN